MDEELEMQEPEELEGTEPAAEELEGVVEAGAEEGSLPSDRVADLVEYLVCAMVESPDAVSLDVTDSDEGTLIEISCAESDAGRVIGRKGRTIKSIRTLARALGQRIGTSVEVEVLG